MTDTHNGCEKCGMHGTIEYTKGKGYLCFDCLREDEEAPDLPLINACQVLSNLQQEAVQAAPCPARWHELDIYHVHDSVFYYYLESDGSNKDVPVSDALIYVRDKPVAS